MQAGMRDGCEIQTASVISSGRANIARPGAGLVPASAITYAVSVVATIYLCNSMTGGMAMPGGWTMSMIWMPMPGQSWLAWAVMFQVMWLAMMVAMMLPSAFPMLMNYRRSLDAGSCERPGLSTLFAACGYFAVWTGIGIVVSAIGDSWAAATMRWASLSRVVPALTGASLMLTGAFQFSPWKAAGLGHCRNAVVHCAAEAPGGWRPSWLYGIREGISCAVCCSGLMLALLVLGSMNLYVMLAIAAIIALEKLLARPQFIVRFTGILSMVSGGVVVISTIF